MPIYAEGIRHQRGCPNDVVEKGLLGVQTLLDSLSDVTDTESESDRENERQAEEKQSEVNKLCSDPRCSTWFDLANWFGYLPLELSPADFEACFTDVAHGGTGLYEKLVVLGAKTLDIMAEMHFYEMFPSMKDLHLPADLKADKEAMRLLWARKRTDRVTSLPGVFLFGKSYLAMAQTFSTRQAVSKYVKACIGYCCQCSDSENLYKWMPLLIEHIFWTQKLRSERLPEDNALLQDLQEFLGYKYDHLIPRIRECLEGSVVPQRSDTPTGRELLRLYATDYFTKMAEETGVEPSRRAVWVSEEVEHFLTSSAIPAFACLCMSLGPYVLQQEEGGPTRAEVFINMFESLVAACWIISTEEKVVIWMPSLIQRLRQTQLVLHMAKMGDKYFMNGTRMKKPAKHPVDVRQFASANNGMIDQFALWNVDPTRRPLAEAPVVYPPAPLYYPNPQPKPLEVSCTPCWIGPRPQPRQVPGRPPNKGVTLFDTEENRYELFSLGPNYFPNPRRRRLPFVPRTPQPRSTPTSSSAHPPTVLTSSIGPSTKLNQQLPHGLDSSIIQSPAPLRVQQSRSQVIEPYDPFSTTFSDGIRPMLTTPWARQSRSTVGRRSFSPEATLPTASKEPRVKIRYLTEDANNANPQNNVEIFVDDVLVHNQTLPASQDPAGTDFKAVFSGPNARPVVLNFARNGNDGRPTVYVTEGRQCQVSQPKILQSSNQPPNTQAPQSCWCAPNGYRVASEEVPSQGSSCFCGQAPQQRASAGPDLGPAPADIMVGPMQPPWSGKVVVAADDPQELESQPDSCTLWNYCSTCMPSTRNSPSSVNQQPQPTAPVSNAAPLTRIYTN